MTERNFYIRQDTSPSGMPWISSAVPGSEDDKALSSGWFTRDDGTQVQLDGCIPVQVCAATARAVEDRMPEWHCFCAICGDNASWRDPS